MAESCRSAAERSRVIDHLSPARLLSGVTGQVSLVSHDLEASNQHTQCRQHGAKTKLQKAQAEAAGDDKQQSLSSLFKFTGRQSPAPRPASAPPTAAAFAPLQRPKAQKFKVKKPWHVDPDELEVRSVLHSVIDSVIADNKETDGAVELECRNTLNSIIDRIELDPPGPKDAFASLKSKRTHYGNKEEILSIIDAEVAAGSSQSEAVKRLRTVSGSPPRAPPTQQWAPLAPRRHAARECAVPTTAASTVSVSRAEDSAQCMERHASHDILTIFPRASR